VAGKRASQKSRDAQKAIVKGAVLRLYSTDLINEDKIKRFLILSVSMPHQSIAKLYFDSNCPPIPYQTPFEKDGRSYLDQKSYLDCSEIYEDNYSRILNQIIKKPSAVIGNMGSKDFFVVKTQIEIATTIPPAIKNKYNIQDRTA
jgi:hypothetical protein